MTVLLARVRAALCPDNPTSWWLLGVAYAKRKCWLESLNALDKALQLNAAHHESIETKADVYFEMEHYGLAAECYKRAALFDHERKYPNRWNNLGVTYGKLKKLDEEVAAYRKALDYDRADRGYWENLVTAYYNARRFKDVVNVCREAIEHIPNDARLWYDLGYGCEELGDLGGASSAFAQAWRLRPNFPGPWMHLIKTLARQRRFAEAAVVCEEVRLFKRNRHAEALALLAGASAGTGNFTFAAEMVSKLSQVDPEEAERTRSQLEYWKSVDRKADNSL